MCRDSLFSGTLCVMCEGHERYETLDLYGGYTGLVEP